MLRTYLPDGDIDISIFTKNEEDPNWYHKFIEKLKEEEKKEKNTYIIKDIQFINANVNNFFNNNINF
jgi:hypothetical protein